MKLITPVTAMLALSLPLAGCGTAPTSIVQGATTARPLTQAQMAAPTSGAIFQVQNYRPHFEDRRARLVGDVINIVITEKTSAVKSGASAGGKSGSVNFKAPGQLAGTFGSQITTSADNKFADNASQSASNTFTGTMGATVVEVLPNGNLIVAGEKQIALDKGVEYIRFSGMINPDTIGTGNTVASTAVADARVEYRTSAKIDRAEMNSMAARFFLSVLPF